MCVRNLTNKKLGAMGRNKQMQGGIQHLKNTPLKEGNETSRAAKRYKLQRNKRTREIVKLRVKGLKQQSSAIAKHYKNVHGTIPRDLLKRFEVLKKCRNKFDCLVYEMLFIRILKPNLNVQSDSIRAKVFS